MIVPTPRAHSISPEQFEFFQRHGYLVIPNALSSDDLTKLLALFEHDHKEKVYLWRQFGDQVINCDALASSPEVDYAIRHPRLLPIIEDLMGGPIVFSEVCLRHMRPHTGETRQSWHRDKPHWLEHPLRMDYIQLALYLTDVSDDTHCFSISPEAFDDEILLHKEQFARGGKHDLHGPAGTAIIFNVSALHTATVRPTEMERKTIQIYYGHQSRPYLSDDSFVPVTLWGNEVEPEIRAFYGKLNERTRLFYAGTDVVSSNEWTG